MAFRAGIPDRHTVWRPPGHQSRATAVTVLLCVLAASLARGAPLYLSPRLDASAGATSNRFLDSQAEASPFLRLAPSLEVLWFGPVGWEAGAGIAHLTTRFTRPGFERQDETSARVSLWRALPAADFSATAQGGVYRDRGVPDDDTTWVQGEVTVRGLPDRPFSPGLTARLTRTHFDTQTAENGTARSDLRWTLDPEFHWQVGSGETLWAGAVLEVSSSNAEAGSYRSFGLSAGFDAQFRDTIGAGIWARWQQRQYDDNRSNNPTGAGAWGTLRLSPWAELATSARYLDQPSTSDLDDYREWSVEAGVRLRYDWPLAR